MGSLYGKVKDGLLQVKAHEAHCSLSQIKSFTVGGVSGLSWFPPKVLAKPVSKPHSLIFLSFSTNPPLFSHKLTCCFFLNFSPL
jgi:hypothetical protein